MRVVGVDPGTRHLGWGVVDIVGTRLAHVAHGVISPPDGDLADRLFHLDRGLHEVLESHRPASAGVESLFFAKDAMAAAKLGHARGIVLLALRRAEVSLAEYAPAEVKRAIAGNGRAEKSQVAAVVRAILGLPTPPASDAADALAIAILHGRAMLVPAALRRPVSPPRRGLPRPFARAKRPE